MSFFCFSYKIMIPNSFHKLPVPELQLKPDHKPVQQLNDWQKKIIPRLTDFEPSMEKPELYLRRDALLPIEEEKKVMVIG